ncbi:MAG TPA: response regulator [Roseiflexaceae bacterium]|nr:response regulator [Roseiflexaceae bacterium]
MSHETHPPAHARSAYPGARALVVDDEMVITSMLCRSLERAGLHAGAAHSGREALERLRSGEYDVVICDLRMPDVSGRELFAQLQAELPAVTRRMIFLTGDTASGDTEDFLRRSGCRYIAKPFELREIIALVDTVLAETFGNERTTSS